jgi:hypothetical protein
LHHGSGVSGSTQEWFFMLGCSVSGRGQNNFDHHVYPDCADHELYKWCRFGKAGVSSNRGMCININWDWESDRVTATPGIVLPARWHLVSECEGMGTESFADAGNRTNNGLGTDNIVQFTGYVVERNAIHDSNTSGAHAMQLPCAKEFTIRGNRFWGNFWASMFSPPNAAFYSGSTTPSNLWAPAVMASKIYSNKFHASSTTNPFQGIINVNDTTFALPQQWTRNTFRDFRTANAILVFDFASMITAGIVIDRNVLYTANATYIVNDVAVGNKNYASYRGGTGFDPNGSNADPGWASTVSQWSDLN